MGVVEEAVEDGVADSIVPVVGGDLAGKQRATASVARLSTVRCCLPR